MSGVYSPTHQINFLYIPKAACTITRQLWYRLHVDEMIRPHPTNKWHAIQADFPKLVPGQPGYVVARHPYFRTISMYTNRLCGPYQDSIQSRSHFKSIMGDIPFTFLNFCHYLQKCKNDKWNHTNMHFVSQSHWLRSFIQHPNFKADDLLVMKCGEPHTVTTETLNQNLQRQFKHTYQTLVGTDEFDAKIDEFFDSKHVNNVTQRDTSIDPEIDHSRTDMVGWNKFPPSIVILTEETKRILAEVYHDDFQWFDFEI